jgi:hypothetical protein
LHEVEKLLEDFRTHNTDPEALGVTVLIATH